MVDFRTNKRMAEVEIAELYAKGMLAHPGNDYEGAVEHFRKVMALAPEGTQYYISSRYNIACNLMSASMESGNGYSQPALELWKEGALHIRSTGDLCFLSQT